MLSVEAGPCFNITGKNVNFLERSFVYFGVRGCIAYYFFLCHWRSLDQTAYDPFDSPRKVEK